MTGADHHIFQLRDRAPVLRCTSCGSPKVKELCVRCHRTFCAAHGRRRRKWLETARRRLPERVNRALLPGPTSGVCAVCEPTTTATGLAVLAGAAVLVLAGLVTLAWSGLTGVLLVLAGITAVVTLEWRRRHGKGRTLWTSDRRFRLTPAVNRISLIDELHVKAALEAGRYSTTTARVGGRLVVEAEWGDRECERARTHIGDVATARTARTTFDAGFLVLRGQAGWVLTATDGCREVRPGILALVDRFDRHPALISDDGSGRRAWRISADYTIAGGAPDVPIWITPTLVPRAGRRALDLEIQWAEFGPGKSMPLLTIDLLRIEVPNTWNRVLRTEPQDARMTVVEHTTGQHERILEWRNITIEDPARGRHRVSLWLKSPVKENDVLKGRIEARFGGTLCRVEHVDVHGMDGRKATTRPPRQRYTRVTLAFDLSLDTLRYEALRIHPVGRGDAPLPIDVPSDESHREPEPTGSVHGIAPDSRTVAAVTAALAETGYYVKRVLENPSRSGREAATIDRFWDIAGRKYEGVYPIDFHLILSGSIWRASTDTEQGRTDFTLAVRGAYSSEEVDRKVYTEWKRLRRVIDRALRVERSAAEAGYHCPETSTVAIHATGDQTNGGPVPTMPTDRWADGSRRTTP